MKFIIVLCVFIYSVTGTVCAQDPSDLLDHWSKRTAIEKVFLHLDRGEYAAAETIWFKAYLYAEQVPDTISTVLYVELLNGSSTVISRQVLPVFLGATNGQIELPDSLSSGAYLLRAYSPTMLNHNTEFIYTRHILVHGKKSTGQGAGRPFLQLIFFPEGGNLVPGVSNTLAFKANDEYGMPVNVKGTIRNEKEETIASFASYHDGMGIVEFTPMRGQLYHAEIENLAESRFELPQLTDNAIALTIIPHPSGFFFDVRQQAADPSKRVAFMLGQMQHHVVFRQEFKRQPEVLEGVIDTRNLSSGIMHVTFFSNQGLPLAERLCFVNNAEFIQEASLVTDTLDYGSYAKNRFSFLMKDTVQGNFSVSVTDADYSGDMEMEEHIASRLLLQSDLPGYIHNPAWYFSGRNDSITTATDLLMMTHGWRRFKWAELEQLSKAPLAYTDPGYITLTGKITLRDSKKPFDEKQAHLFISAGSQAQNLKKVTTDKQGMFRLDSLLFFGKSRVMYTDSRGKKALYIDVHPAKDSITRNYPGLPTPAVPAGLLLRSNEAKWKKTYEDIMKANGLLLEGITLNVRKKSPSELVDELYTRGAFSGEARKSFDLVNSDEGDFYRSVFHFLEAKGFLPNSRNLPTISSMGEINTVIYLDELPVDIDLELLPMNKVALIKVFSNFVGEWGAGPGGVIAIYTKKGETMTMGAIKGDVVHYPGFSIVKEFFAPDYRKSPDKEIPDNRITLDWRPDIFINNINPRVPVSFYNNNRTKRFRVRIQGMTANGKMVFIDRVLDPQTKGF